MRFVVLLTSNESIIAAYLKSTDSKDRDALDYDKSENRELDWMDMICELFNDENVIVETPPVPSLHEKFANTISCPKGRYTLTKDKCKDLIMDQKTKLRSIINRYQLSGNGSDMVSFDNDTDNEAEIVENEETYGRFNAARAMRRSDRRTDFDKLKLVNGDDRSSFLRQEPIDLLMWYVNNSSYLIVVYYIAYKQ